MTDTGSPTSPDDGVRQFRVTSQAGVAIVTAPAEIDNGNVELLQEALADASAESPTIVVDLIGTDFCDSSGISVLVAAQRLAMARGGEVMLAINMSTMRRIFKLTGADRLFSIFETLQSARAAADLRGSP